MIEREMSILRMVQGGRCFYRTVDVGCFGDIRGIAYVSMAGMWNQLLKVGGYLFNVIACDAKGMVLGTLWKTMVVVLL